MKRTINIKSEGALNDIEEFKNKRYVMCDIRFENTNLRDVNKLIGSNLFSKNDLFVNSVALWEFMQPKGEKGSHNYHGLTPQDILRVFTCLFLFCFSKGLFY